MKYQIAKAQREYENSAELRYEREVENTYQQKVRGVMLFFVSACFVIFSPFN